MRIVRAFFVAACAAIGLLGVPGGLIGLGSGVVLGAVVVVLEVRLHGLPPNVLMGGVMGTFLGLLLAIGFGLAGRQLDLPNTTEATLQGIALLMFGYLGMVIGALKGRRGEWWIPWKQFGELPTAAAPDKLLDSSVLIDGRVAEIIEARFIEGNLVIPQFVLRELQQVADSNDALKRGRGRRGLDIVQRLQDQPALEVDVDQTDFQGLDAVDDKLIELAIRRNAAVVTNDFNLAKVARVRGVEILNINDLANAVKPAFLPGERMDVLIAKDGKEPGQGVGYLDDGTMVVVDGARADRGQTIGLVVTSVLQTNAGKMIFGKKPDDPRVVQGSMAGSAS